MPFYSSPKLEVRIVSESGKRRFARTSVSDVVAYEEDVQGDASSLKVVAAQRVGTGEPLEHSVLQLKPAVTPKLGECFADIKFFRLEFDGGKLNRLLQDRCEDTKRTDLYSSILCRGRVLLTLETGTCDLRTLEVNLDYRLKKLEQVSRPPPSPG